MNLLFDFLVTFTVIIVLLNCETNCDESIQLKSSILSGEEKVNILLMEQFSYYNYTQDKY
jgi:hypothetical protein